MLCAGLCDPTGLLGKELTGGTLTEPGGCTTVDCESEEYRDGSGLCQQCPTDDCDSGQYLAGTCPDVEANSEF